MRARRASAFALLLLAGCAGPYISPLLPPPHREQVAASYGATWKALIEALAKENVPLRVVAKDSGVIASDDFVTTIGVYADCGRFGDARLEGEALITFTMFVNAAGSNGTEVQINAKMRTQAHRTGPSGKLKPQPVFQCASTGRWESNLLDAVRAMVRDSRG